MKIIKNYSYKQTKRKTMKKQTEIKLRKLIKEEVRKVLSEGDIVPNYKVGDKVMLTSDALENYGSKYKDKVFKVEIVSTSTDDHPGFDDGMGEALYDLKNFNNSVYDYEITYA